MLQRGRVNLAQHRRQAIQHRRVLDAQHPIAGRAQPRLPVGVRLALRGVDRPIDLDDEQPVRAAEIGDEGADGVLAAKRRAIAATVAQCRPEARFRRRLPPAQLPRRGDVVAMAGRGVGHGGSVAEERQLGQGGDPRIAGCVGGMVLRPQPSPTQALTRGRHPTGTRPTVLGEGSAWRDIVIERAVVQAVAMQPSPWMWRRWCLWFPVNTLDEGQSGQRLPTIRRDTLGGVGGLGALAPRRVVAVLVQVCTSRSRFVSVSRRIVASREDNVRLLEPASRVRD